MTDKNKTIMDVFMANITHELIELQQKFDMLLDFLEKKHFERGDHMWFCKCKRCTSGVPEINKIRQFHSETEED